MSHVVSELCFFSKCLICLSWFFPIVCSTIGVNYCRNLWFFIVKIWDREWMSKVQRKLWWCFRAFLDGTYNKVRKVHSKESCQADSMVKVATNQSQPHHYKKWRDRPPFAEECCLTKLWRSSVKSSVAYSAPNNMQ